MSFKSRVGYIVKVAFLLALSIYIVILMLLRLFVAALWSHAGGGGLASCPLFVIFDCVFVTFPCVILGQLW